VSGVPGRHDPDWRLVPGTTAEPTENIPTIPRDPTKAQHFQKELPCLGHIVAKTNSNLPETEEVQPVVSRDLGS
jgi:hypothetical protein